MKPSIVKPPKSIIPEHANATIEIGRVSIDVSVFASDMLPDETPAEREQMVRRITDAIHGILDVPTYLEWHKRNYE